MYGPAITISPPLYLRSSGKDNSEFAIQPYAGRYNFWLFCNFTFFLNDPVNGDMIEPTDSRQLLGLNAKYKFYPNLGLGVATATLGGAYRADDMDVAPWHSHNCVRLEKRVDANIAERSLSLHFTPGNPRNLRLGG